MKRLAFSLLILALILPAMVITGCSTGDDDPVINPEDNNPSEDPGDDTTAPSGNLGDDELILKGKVFTETVNGRPVYTVDYESYSAPGVMEASAIGFGLLGTGTLTNGEFDISITKKPTTGLLNSDQFAQINVFWGWDDATMPEFQFAQIHFIEQNSEKSIRKGETILSSTSPWTIYIFVDYLYVDRDVTITLDGKRTDSVNGDLDYTQIYEKSVLNLEKGWNALTTKWVETGTATSYTHTTTVSVENPDLYWIIR